MHFTIGCPTETHCIIFLSRPCIGGMVKPVFGCEDDEDSERVVSLQHDYTEQGNLLVLIVAGIVKEVHDFILMSRFD